ncbi:type II secretion system protein [bacterium]|nr:MAG: type II secretion system protein [bacterium]
MRRGFTLTEMLFSMGIVMLLAGIIGVLVTPAKDAAAIVASKSNLRQLHLATALYQSVNDGDGVYGSTYRMGLPLTPAYETLPILTQIRPPRAPALKDSKFGICYWLYYMDPNKDSLTPNWERYSNDHEGQSVLYSDPFNNDSSVVAKNAPLYRRRLLGVTVDGNLLDRRRPGDWMERTWWHDQP